MRLLRSIWINRDLNSLYEIFEVGEVWDQISFLLFNFGKRGL